VPKFDPGPLAEVVVQAIARAHAPLLERIKSLEAQLASQVPLQGEKGLDGAQGPPGERGPEGPIGIPGRDGRDGLPGVPGVQGEKGIDGINGLNGKDGTDGLGFDDFEELYDGERTWTRRYIKGDRVKEFVFKTPMDIYRGVYVEGKTYDRGDGVTWGGSEWHCNEQTTTKPGEGSKAWTLKVKRGRDGKDGKDGERGPAGRDLTTKEGAWRS
jgi:integrin beta 3